ncbi:hypothetical protein OIU77_015193 [Salix suchowensis]|uniref:Uncharacterized protein n=1 Tax=Salix suchowensis TaxID=1278906 RepID=A0ABQ8ZRW6_9ROSI|nr:hypothetical protein OIU77_015193 [Salix suchowensis]
MIWDFTGGSTLVWSFDALRSSTFNGCSVRFSVCDE